MSPKRTKPTPAEYASRVARKLIQGGDHQDLTAAVGENPAVSDLWYELREKMETDVYSPSLEERDEAEARLKASLASDDARDRLSHYQSAEGALSCASVEAAYMVGLEVGRRLAGAMR